MNGRFLPVGTDQTSGWLKKQIQVYDNMHALNPMYFQLKRFRHIHNGYKKVISRSLACHDFINLLTKKLSLLTCMFL